MTYSIVVGETFDAQICAEALSIVARFRGPSSHDVDATGSGSTWAVTVDTTGWTPGNYRWQAWATRADGTKKVVVDLPLTVRDTIDSATGSFISTAEQNVANLEAMMSGGQIAAGVRKYKINNRELENYAVAEILDMLRYWRRRLVREKRIARGQSPNGPRIAFYC